MKKKARIARVASDEKGRPHGADRTKHHKFIISLATKAYDYEHQHHRQQQTSMDRRPSETSRPGNKLNEITRCLEASIALTGGVTSNTSPRPTGQTATSRSPTTSRNFQTSSTKSVSFAPKLRCLIIPSLQDMTDDDIASIWVTEEDAKANQEGTTYTIRAARRQAQARDDDATDYCLRGLECIIRGTKHYREIQKRRNDLIHNVLLIQSRHWELGCDQADPNVLRTISERFSEEQVTRAIALGASDAAYVHRLHRSGK